VSFSHDLGIVVLTTPLSQPPPPSLSSSHIHNYNFLVIIFEKIVAHQIKIFSICIVVVYFMMLSLAPEICRMVGWLMSIELRMIWKEEDIEKSFSHPIKKWGNSQLSNCRFLNKVTF